MDASPSHIGILLLWLLCTIMLNSAMGNLKIQCNEKDMYTLLNFKQGVIDPSGMLSSWFPEQDCCQWIGVQCDNVTNRVTEFSLPCHTNFSPINDRDNKSHCVTGELDLSLLELEFLSHLNLSNNDFKAIQYNSHQSGNSSHLHYLDLSYNYDILVDSLNWISRLSSLEYLNLNGIDLHKEMDWLQFVTSLPSLLELYLGSCQLKNIYQPFQFANFTSLQVLDLADNDFRSELPIWLFNLSCDISYINLGQNHIHGQLPKTLLNLRSIKSLYLYENNLDGPIPYWLGQLQYIQKLELHDNSFFGPIPTSLGNLSSLITLRLEINILNGSLPESLGQLFNLKKLGVGDNFLTGIVSERNFLSLSNLKHLFLGSPALKFDFDPKWVPPFQLQGIELGYVSPKLPSWLIKQSSIKILTIKDSWASFEPLDKFWNFAQLEFLSLHNNTINANMSNVMLNSKVAWLKSNKLKGGLPQLSPNVVMLSLRNNSLCGSISPLLCQTMKEKSNLKYMDISHNLLSGELTDCWMYWKSLVHVNLGNNNLTGKIPHSMGLLSNLISLHLNNNKFFGDVPLSLKSYENLWILNLSDNKFSGVIPYWIGYSARALQLRSNQFSGSIPSHICQINSLIVVDFANNRLSGAIPNCLHNITAVASIYASTDRKYKIRIQLSQDVCIFPISLMLLIKGNKLYFNDFMYVIDLSSNNLSGSMPSEIFGLMGLQSLNLSHNRLMGKIPKEVGNMKQLESIDLSNNWLSGEIPQSMSALSFLGFLNLSFNNFMGKIPSGTQLQGFTNLSYIGNPELYGPPLTNNCTQDKRSDNEKPKGEDDDDEFEVHSWFYMGMGIGFAMGFWGVLSIIFFNKTCRHAYFRFLNNIEDRLYYMVVIKLNFFRPVSSIR